MKQILQLNRDVAVVGAGPCGLFLACRLAQQGVSCLVLEQRPSPSTRSRAVGLHPPSLARLDRMGLADAFLAGGRKVQTGRVFNEQRCLGQLSFEPCPLPYNFVLTHPQSQTERLLEQQLARWAPAALHRGWTVRRLQPHGQGVLLRALAADGATMDVQARYVAGCDGKSGFVRGAAGMDCRGGPYPRQYAMGDFVDLLAETPGEAFIWLGADGLVESFPLPGNQRRWVASLPLPPAALTTPDFRRLIRQRTGHELLSEPAGGLQLFGVQHYLASPFVKGRVALAGDAAHVLPPFGGLGLNLGWLDAWDLAEALRRILHRHDPAEPLLAFYNRRASARARRVLRHAEWNMRLGGPVRHPRLRAMAIQAALGSPFRPLLARRFAMLDLRPIL